MNRVLILTLFFSVSPLSTMAHAIDKGTDMPMPADDGMSMDHAMHEAEPSPSPSPSTTQAGPTVAPTVSDYAADQVYDPASMARARAVLHEEHGGELQSKVMLNLFEYQTGSDADAYRWDGDAWFGSDINRLVLKSEGEGSTAKGVATAELQALYSRAVSPYSDLQIGVRQDIDPNPARTYAAFGVNTLFPYWFETDAEFFVATTGDVLGRVTGIYDFRLTEHLLLQPRAELNFSANDIPDREIGVGLSTAELGLRLRYEVRREFAPYIGITYDRKIGQTATFARATGNDVSDTRFVMGVRAWF